MVDLDRSISIATKSGKTEFGMKRAVKAARNGDAMAIVVAANAPDQMKEDVLRYASLSEIPVIPYPKKFTMLEDCTILIEQIYLGNQPRMD